MKPNKLVYALVKKAAEKGVRDVREDPERGIRNIVDLGRRMAGGPYQQSFFDMAQVALQDRGGAYYSLAENVARQVDSDALVSFGMNLGYNSLTVGVNQIRETESAAGHSVPWALIVHLPDDPRKDSSAFLKSIVSQAKPLGIYCYMVFVPGKPADFSEVFETIQLYDDCAFLLFVQPEFADECAIKLARKTKNAAIMLNIGADKEQTLSASKKMLDAKLLYGGYVFCENVEEEAQAYVLHAAKLNLPFLFFVQTDGAWKTIKNKPDGFIINHRNEPRESVFPVDLYADIAMVSSVVSSTGYLVRILEDGQVEAFSCANGELVGRKSLRDATLENIFSQMLRSAPLE